MPETKYVKCKMSASMTMRDFQVGVTLGHIREVADAYKVSDKTLAINGCVGIENVFEAVFCF